MATVTGYMITRSDFTTINPFDRAGEVDATPGGVINLQYSPGDGLGGPGHTGGHVSENFEIWLNLVEVCNVMWQDHSVGGSRVDAGYRLVKIQFDDVTDILASGSPGVVKRADVIAEVVAATIGANATVS
jgi:hypothetical protein